MKFLSWLWRPSSRAISLADANARLAKLMRDTPRPYYRPEWAKPSDKVRPA